METLADLLRRRRLRPDEAMDLLRVISFDVLQRAITDDIIGFLRPANVRVGGEGDELPFALKLEDRSADPQWTAPEQIRGEAGDRRTDVYLTGLLVFVSLTGHRPPRDAPLTNAAAYGLSPALGAVLARALDPDPDRRFANVVEMAVVSDEAVENPYIVPDEATPPGRMRGVERSAREWVRAFAPLVIGFAVVAVIAVLAAVRDGKPSSDEAPTSPTYKGPPLGHLRLRPLPAAHPDAAGVAGFTKVGEETEIVVDARLSPNRGDSEAYEVWLYNSRNDAFSAGAHQTDGRGYYRARAEVPDDYARYRFVDISLEKVRSKKAHSGRSVLRGRIADLPTAP